MLKFITSFYMQPTPASSKSTLVNVGHSVAFKLKRGERFCFDVLQ
jgi:hypothetical protein